MRGRVLLFISLAANLVLAAVWILCERHIAHFSRASLGANPASAEIKTNVVIRRQFFTWQQVESDDYPTYIANLRDIGCPEQTIRDIIIADVNALYARKRATEIVTPDQQWWRSEPDTNVLQIAAARIRELDEERRALLTELLGPSWETGDLVSLPRPSRAGVALDGPVLGLLPEDVKKSVQRIAARLEERIQAYMEAQRAAGKLVDPAEIARMRQQTRQELTRVLSPQQLEEYNLRYSQDAGALRGELGQLKFFNATPDEFRTVFRAIDQIDQQLQLLAGATDPDSVQQRKTLEDQRLNAIKLALGPERFAQYVALHDDVYRDSYAAALQADMPQATPALYEINQATAQELARIQADTNLTAEQRNYELKKAELEQIAATAEALGQELPSEPPPPPPPPPMKTHVVAAGEGINFLAELYGVQPAAIRAANPNLDFTKLPAGTPVKIPIIMVPMPAPPQ